MYAQSCTDTKEKVAELLKGLDLEAEVSSKVQALLLQREKRQDTQGLKTHLTTELGLSESRATAIVEAANDLEATPKVNGVANGVDGVAPPEIKEPVLITDVRAFKASLTATSGARPVKDMSEYEDVDCKL